MSSSRDAAVYAGEDAERKGEANRETRLCKDEAGHGERGEAQGAKGVAESRASSTGAGGSSRGSASGSARGSWSGARRDGRRLNGLYGGRESGGVGVDRSGGRDDDRRVAGWVGGHNWDNRGGLARDDGRGVDGGNRRRDDRGRGVGRGRDLDLPVGDLGDRDRRRGGGRERKSEGGGETHVGGSVERLTRN